MASSNPFAAPNTEHAAEHAMAHKKDQEGTLLLVQVGEPWPDDIDIREESPCRRKRMKIGVHVGELWPEGIKVNTDTSATEKGAKLSVLKRVTGLITLQQITFTIYGWLYSQEFLKEILRINVYLLAVMVLWAIGPKVSSKIMTIAKAIVQSENDQHARK